MTRSFDDLLGPPRRLQLEAGPIEYHDRGEGRPIVFLHGLVLNAGFWRHVASELAADHRCIVPTLPLGGHRLPVRPEADLSPPGIAGLVLELLERLDLEDTVLVANDTGGAFAQIAVTTRPDRVGALVLTPCDAFEHFLPRQFRFLQVLAHLPGSAWQMGQVLRSPLVRRSPLGFGLLTKHGIDDEVSAAYVESLRRSSGVRRDVTKVLKGISNRYTLAAAERLGEFDRPSLLAWASEDRLFLDSGRRLADLIPNARLELIDDSFTYIPEDQPRRLVASIREFLAASETPSRPAVSHE